MLANKKKMIMKKFLYIFASSMFLLWGCEPMEDVYNKLDEQQGPYSEDIEVTLEDGDYSTLSDIAAKMGDSDAAAFIDDNMAFSPDYMAADFVPGFLSQEYIALNKNSSAKVTFNYMQAPPEYLSKYTLSYSVDSADYAGIDPMLGKLKAFSPSFPAEGNINGIIDGQFADAENGSVAFVSYRVSDIDLSSSGGSPEIFREDFNGSLGSFQTFDVLGGQSWSSSGYGGDEYAKMSGYSSGAQENEDWLVSPSIDLSGYNSAYVVLNQAVNFLDDWANIQVMVSTDFDGSDVTSATWNELTINTKPSGGDWSFVQSEEIDLADYLGESINIAFKYQSTTSGAATWEVDWMSVETNDVPKPKYSYFDKFFEKIDGVWVLKETDTFDDGKYILSSEDYDAMGAPGKYNNFSSSDDPADYLPALLLQKQPYAQAEDKAVVIYKYYAGSTESRADEYVFDGAVWQNSSRIVSRTEQFVHNGTKWVFDPTVVFTMKSEDYQMVVDFVKTEIENGSSYLNSYGTGEYYYGADAYYENFDLRLSNRTDNNVPGFDGLSNEEAIALTHDRLAEAVEVLLQVKYPNAVTQVNGVDVHYIVTVDTYENDLSRGKYTYDFQCVSNGPNPQFDLVEGPQF